MGSSSEVMIRQRLGAVRRALPGAKRGDVDTIHQARVGTRRLRAALPLVTSGSLGRKLKRVVRRLTRSLGPVRELDVALQMLEEFSGAGDVPRAGIAHLRQVVEDERRRHHAQMLRSIERCDMEKLAKKTVAAARERVAGSRGGRVRDPLQLAAAERRAARRADRLRQAIDSAAGIYLPDRLHEVRIAAKKLRYAMEIAHELSRSRATARILALKRAQDLLGRMHDLEVLIARTRAVQGSPKAPTLRVSAGLDLLVRRLETECRQLHAQYIAARPKLLAICEHVVAVPERRVRGASAA